MSSAEWNKRARSVVRLPETCVQAVLQGYVMGKLKCHTLNVIFSYQPNITIEQE